MRYTSFLLLLGLQTVHAESRWDRLAREGLLPKPAISISGQQVRDNLAQGNREWIADGTAGVRVKYVDERHHSKRPRPPPPRQAKQFSQQVPLLGDTTSIVQWSQLGQNISTHAPSQAGIAISGDGQRVAIGQPFDDFNRGRVTIYHYNATKDEWEEKGHLNGLSINDHMGDKGGHFVMSRDGNHLVAQAGLISRGTKLANQTHVTISEYNSASDTWQIRQRIYIIKPISVDISGDGSRIVVARVLEGFNMKNRTEGNCGSRIDVWERQEGSMSDEPYVIQETIELSPYKRYINTIKISSCGNYIVVPDLFHTQSVRVYARRDAQTPMIRGGTPRNTTSHSSLWYQLGEDIPSPSVGTGFGGTTSIAMTPSGSLMLVLNQNAVKEVDVYRWDRVKSMWVETFKATGDLHPVHLDLAETTTNPTIALCGAGTNGTVFVWEQHDSCGNLRSFCQESWWQLGHVAYPEVIKCQQVAISGVTGDTVATGHMHDVRVFRKSSLPSADEQKFQTTQKSFTLWWEISIVVAIAGTIAWGLRKLAFVLRNKRKSI